jgi:hypothetical protein
MLYLFLVSVIASMFAIYDRYIYRQDFAYFESEDDLPDALDISTYER